MRTVLIFTDIPSHYEYAVSDWPVLDVNDVIDLNIELRNPKDPTRFKKMDGDYMIIKKKNKHSTSEGFIQYLELKSC
jgi:hypothetical protein